MACCFAPAGLWAAEPVTQTTISPQVIEQIDQAKPLAVENLVVPIRDIRGPVALYVANPHNGSMNAVIHYFETYSRNHHLMFVEMATGKVKHVHLPSGLYNNHFVAHKQGKIYSHGPKGLCVYDTATNELTNLGESIGGETRPMTLGPDGMIYGTGSSNSMPVAYQINPETNAVTKYGTIGPSHAPNNCWGYFVNADENYVYVASGKIPWRLVAYNRKTKESKVLITLDDARGLISFGAHNGKRTANLRHSDKPDERYWLGDGQITLIEKTEDAPPAHTSDVLQSNDNPGKVEVTGDLKPDGKGNVAVTFKLPDGKTMAVKYNVPIYPTNIYQVVAGPDGKIYGSGGNYLGLFVYDPATGESEHLKKMPISVPLLNWIDGKLVMTGYPSGNTMLYDPAKPWTTEKATANPKHLTYLAHDGAGFHTPYDAIVGSDNKLYAVGGWYRNGNGGGLGWYDVAARKGGGIHDGMGNYRTTHLTSVSNGRYMVMSTRTVLDQETTVPPPPQAKIFVYDTKTATLNSFETLAGINHTGMIAGGVGDSTTVLAITSDPAPADKDPQDRGSVLYAFDALTGKVLWQKKLPYANGFIPNENYDGTVGSQMSLGPDGMIWTWTGGKLAVVDPERSWGLSYEDAKLVRIDPANGDIHVVGMVGMAGKFAFLGKDIYLTGGSKYHSQDSDAIYLRRIKGVLK